MTYDQICDYAGLLFSLSICDECKDGIKVNDIIRMSNVYDIGMRTLWHYICILDDIGVDKSLPRNYVYYINHTEVST